MDFLLPLLGEWMLDASKALRKTQITYGKKSRRTVSAFVFECTKCGVEIVVSSHKLNRSMGMCQPCCCAHSRLSKQLRPFEWVYRRLLRCAKERQISVQLTYDKFLLFTEASCCHYCADLIPWRPFNNDRNKTAGTWLDRKDNGGGYVTGNIVVCCSRCNRMKGFDLSYEEMLLLSPVLKAITARRREAGKRW